MTTDISAALEVRRRRATYRANYRGTKEMDWLLGKFAEAHLAGMDEMSLTRFEQFLALPDPDLNAWILDPARVTGLEFAALIDQIRNFHDLHQTLDRPMTGSER